MNVLNGMEIKAKTSKILEILCENLKQHKTIVEEARVGYVDRAKVALELRLDELRSGKLKHLGFDLHPPQDHSSVYDTAIKMMELSEDPIIELTADQVQNLILDNWHWSEQWFMQNAPLSATANVSGKAKGYDIR